MRWYGPFRTTEEAIALGGRILAAGRPVDPIVERGLAARARLAVKDAERARRRREDMEVRR
jgi:hypothetical protein